MISIENMLYYLQEYPLSPITYVCIISLSHKEINNMT